MKKKVRKEKKSEDKINLQLPPFLLDLSPEEIRYEKARIIGIRAQQLLEGAEPLIEVPKGITDPIQIAKLEFEAKKLPFLIKRGSDIGLEKLEDTSS